MKSLWKKWEATLVMALALFSLFFGAGDLILPPQLGFKAGGDWWLLVVGFSISAVFIPIIGIMAHAKLQGTMFDFGKKVSPLFSLIYCYAVYAISILLPSPRTASVTHEMGIAPLFDSSPLLTSAVYFSLVFVFVMNRSRIMDIIGKFLTPAIVIILLAIIVISVFTASWDFGLSSIEQPVSYGILEGYQTFGAIGAVVVGGVVIVSLNLKQESGDYNEKKKMIGRAGWISGMGLLTIYGGLILSGALLQDQFDPEMNRTGLVSAISSFTLGNQANLLLSVLISLACFTTAVGIVTGTADFVKSRFDNSQKAYAITALTGSFLGVLMGQLNVDYIIAVAVPALMFIYPLTIVLIILNALPEKWTSVQVFRWVAGATVVFSIPDFLSSLGVSGLTNTIAGYIPFAAVNLGWSLPALAVFLIVNLLHKSSKNPN
ncbi:branched-chain amino acid transport system II carrier protein [Lentiprolixibacter aurantiacus]|uniref:Branched-chain amino acid transport system II carrier protein n=1 Tax=Lentiprolixibacter aurantiacus TaxID=2993939 RepID=A0AAE3MJB5_9FLAO|nr:branched-chain amino acid transport system II carrier protein [Lentiprolixibacter aurantiacus]